MVNCNYTKLLLVIYFFGSQSSKVLGLNSKEIFLNYKSTQDDSYVQWLTRSLRRLEAGAPKTCETDLDCEKVKNSYYVCVVQENQQQKICEHKPLWPLKPIEWVGTILFSLIMLLSNVAGIGGGGIAIPMVQIFFGWEDLKEAIAISSFSICCASFGRFFFNWKERHPEKPQMAAIDYGLTNIMMPLALIGTQVGAFLYLVAPAMVINIILTLLLVWLWIKSCIKMMAIIKKEREDESKAKIADAKIEENKQVEQKNTSSVAPAPEEGSKDTEMVEIKKDTENETERLAVTEKDKGSTLDKFPLTGDPEKDAEINQLSSLIKQEEGHFIWKKQLLNFVCLAINITMNICRKIVFDKCQAADWVTICVFILLMGVAVYIAVNLIAKEQGLKKKYDNINIAKSDLAFEGADLRKLLVLGFFGGFVAGALGLGGGVIFNPYLIGMGVPPKVSSSTGMYLVMFSTTAASIVYILSEKLDIVYGIWVAVWSILGSMLGLYGAGWYMKKFGRQSVIVIALTFVLFLAVIGQPTYNFMLMARQMDQGEDVIAFGSICEAKKK